MPIRTLNHWTRAVNEGELENLLSLYAEDATFIPTFSAQPIRSQESIRNYFTRLLAQPDAAVKVSEHSVSSQTLPGNIFIVNGPYSFHSTEQDRPVRHEARFTFVINPDLGSPILHHHSA